MSGRSRLLLGIGFIVVVTAVAYAPAYEAGFIWDDDYYVTENPLLTAPDGLRRIWFSTDAPSQYFPLVYTSFRIEYALWGDAAAGYHAVNVVLHILNALLLWRVLWRLSVPGAWLAGAVFALHPVHVESVAWITERKNVLSTLFYLGSLVAWMRWLARDRTRGLRDYALSLFFFALALFAKTTACTLPAGLVLVAWLQGIRLDARRKLALVPYVAMGLAMGLVAIWWEQNLQGTRGDRFALAPLESILVAGRAIGFYLEKLVWPVDLAFSYPRFEIDPANPVGYLWPIGSLLLAAVLWVGRSRFGRGPIAAYVFFVASLSPLLGFIPLFTFLYTFVADHYVYVASMGPIALLSALAALGFGKMGSAGKRASALAALLLFSALGLATWNQAGTYESPETLWRHTLESNPNSWMAEHNLGRALLGKGRYREAIAHYQRALTIRPDMHRPHRGIALALRALGRPEAALRHLDRAIELKPDFVRAYRQRGAILLELGRPSEAVPNFEAVLERVPDDAQAAAALERARREAAR